MLKNQIIALFLLLPFLGLAQRLDTLITPDINIDLLEDYIQNQGGDDGTFDLDDIFNDLKVYQRKPLNLNKATIQELSTLRLLTDIQINDLISYRSEAGELLALQELQSIPSFDQKTIDRILPFVKVSGDVDDYNVGLFDLMAKGSNEVYVRYRRTLEEKKGYTNGNYLGDANQYYFNFRHQYENRMSYGITLEKDPGEEFFSGSNAKQGFDYISGHLYMQKYSKFLKYFTLGDFSANMGQGLMLFQGFSGSKGAAVTSIRRTGRPLRHYASLGEYNFLRGVGATLNITDNLEFTAFGSYNQFDGCQEAIVIGSAGQDSSICILSNEEPLIIDPFDPEGGAQAITLGDVDPSSGGLFMGSLGGSGLHRTSSEIVKKKTINAYTGGGILKYHTDQWHVAVNGLYSQLDTKIPPSDQPYQQYNFSGDQFVNVGVDYSYIYQNFNFFGEVATNLEGTSAVNGLIIGLDRHVSMALHHRYLDKKFVGYYGDPFSESGKNEHGMYLGLEVRPSKKWTIATYYDFWKHPFLRYQTDGPSKGNEFFTRVTYYRKRKMKVYMQYRTETKQKNAPDNITAADFLTNHRKQYFRIHFENKITKALELRNRFEYTWYDNEVEATSRGFLLYQDVIYKPLAALHFTSRFAIFDTDSYDSRLYAFENNVLRTFSIPPYSGRGTRFYLNLRYRGIRNMVAELRYAQTYFADVETVSSGNEEIDGNTRSEVVAQLKFKF